ncbi:MAG: sialidase, partial [Bosea sp.]|nr:sialidase [Bosea sp. (in: a-proteobacteria)]
MPAPRTAGWLCAAALALSATAPGFAQETLSAPAEIPDGVFDELKYRHIGPVGNRVIAVTGEPGDPRVYYAGAASGGIFKTTDGGAHWQPIFDHQPAASIGSLAVAPSDPNVVWAGTGETFIRANVSIGNGIYKSTDGGETWRHMGLKATGRIGRVIVHPTDPDVVYAAALGHCYGPQPERGVYRTTDGGENWEKVLFVDDQSGAIDLVMDP